MRVQFLLLVFAALLMSACSRNSRPVRQMQTEIVTTPESADAPRQKSAIDRESSPVTTAALSNPKRQKVQALDNRTDEQIAMFLIQQSIRSYPGKCACPYQRASRGRCGRRSAYSKPGGASPLCYPADVVKLEMIADARRRVYDQNPRN